MTYSLHWIAVNIFRREWLGFRQRSQEGILFCERVDPQNFRRVARADHFRDQPGNNTRKRKRVAIFQFANGHYPNCVCQSFSLLHVSQVLFFITSEGVSGRNERKMKGIKKSEIDRDSAFDVGCWDVRRSKSQNQKIFFAKIDFGRNENEHFTASLHGWGQNGRCRDHLGNVSV